MSGYDVGQQETKGGSAVVFSSSLNMPAALAQIHQVIRQALADDRVGTPVATRVLLHGPADHGQLEWWLACALDAACDWLNAEPVKLLARGGPDQGHIAAQALGDGGQSILASVALAGSLRPRAEVVLLGNQGIALWQSDPDFPLPIDDSSAATAKLTSRATRLLADIRRARASGRFEPLAGAAQPIVSSAPRGVRPAAWPKSELPAFKPLKPPYGVLLVAGGQSHQEMYGPAFAKDPRCRVIGLTDADDITPRRRELNADLAKSMGIPVLPDIAAALARDDVHLVSICADPQRRAPLILKAAAAGKHLYLDKPLSATIEEADEIAAAARNSGVQNQMFSMTHQSAAARARQLVQSGALGSIIAVHCDAFFAKGPAGQAKLGSVRRETARPSTFEVPEAKRELHNVGVYPLVFLRWLLGSEPRRVTATTANYFFAEHQQHDMEDFAQLTIDFDGGIIGTVSAGRTGWRSHPAGGHNRVHLVGTQGTLAVDMNEPRMEVWKDEDGWQHPARNPQDPMGFWVSTVAGAGVPPKQSWYSPAETMTDVRYFIDCLEAGRASDVTAEAGARAMELIIGAYESAATGEPVELPLARLH